MACGENSLPPKTTPRLDFVIFAGDILRALVAVPVPVNPIRLIRLFVDLWATGKLFGLALVESTEDHRSYCKKLNKPGIKAHDSDREGFDDALTSVAIKHKSR